MKQKLFTTYLFINALILLGACSSDDDSATDNGGEGPVPTSKYIITANPTASEGVADYILTTEDLTQGSITTEGNGIEQDGTYRYYVTNNNKFFSLLYGQGNPGAVTTYELNADGELEKLSDFQSETVQARAAVNDDVLMIKLSRDLESPYAYWYRLDTNTSTFVDEGQINTEVLADNGELAYFSWITQVGDMVFLPYFGIKACCNDADGTNFPDQANIAVYSYPEMELQTVIHDNRTSFIGRYANTGLSVDEKGDAYTFSSSVAMSNGEFTSTKPSAVTKITSGSLEFDTDYFFNLEEASGGYYLTNHYYVSNGKFLGFMEKEKVSQYDTGRRLAVIDVYNQSFTWIEGLPEYTTVTNVTARNNYVSEDGTTIYTGITSESDGSYVYAIDILNATAEKGLKVEGGVISAISKLDIAQQ
ncbi:DUF4374 domain-containing protein [Galbibacter pacificus]|uniref:DUF4374 domain-containing protein n=1 Tax=Galbibacter pacificus TaxID=2996052 RepID=A0ABT6FN69_9FLAO|nr:DUF4374 domain-containing protein [Galbibacter pacificus]MDG3581227.1 DUF4374 domain-containing protein [Galbibacter pacificus]MDG3584705.1 DUF4374 domain-containing protein [Galbibacter pacificus]